MPKTAKCPQCDADLNITDDAEVGEIISCDECGAELEVKALTPSVVLDDAPAVKEDWGE
ncbi:MAG: lysine biosynthesis protein LysW [Patescibacteria group bacterium]|jgi:alpha-aminoadipate carrier protein LysW